MRWFTSDTHFAKIGDKILRREMRPYKTIKEYCDDQIRIWNEQASRDDVIYHLGDMCNYNGTEKDFLPGLMLVQEVNAKVILIMGNNEERVMQYCFENNFEKFRDFCIRHGFLDVKQNDTISIDGAKLYLVHRPIDCKPGMLNLYGPCPSARRHLESVWVQYLYGGEPFQAVQRKRYTFLDFAEGSMGQRCGYKVFSRNKIKDFWIFNFFRASKRSRSTKIHKGGELL